MIARHSLSQEAFEELATGHGGPAVVRQLRAIEVSKHMLLLRRLLDATVHSAAAAYEQARLTEAFDLLAECSATDAEGTRMLIGRPQTGAWAMSCLRRTRLQAFEVAHLGSLTVSAAIGAGLDGDVAVPSHAGLVYLPSLGSARVEGEGIVHIRASELGRDITLSMRRLRAVHDSLAIEVELDDLDPYRDCGGWEPIPRLAEDELIRWQELLGQAWSLLAGRRPELAEALRLGLTTIVPLQRQTDGNEISASARRSSGAVAMSLPTSPTSFALTLVHEFQHMKLGALLDLLPLYQADQRRYYSPWRDDPRPVGGLLQGAYAYLGVADFWRGEDELRFALALDQVVIGCDGLRDSRRLTKAGEAFVATMRANALDATDEVERSTMEHARSANRERRERWRLSPSRLS